MFSLSKPKPKFETPTWPKLRETNTEDPKKNEVEKFSENLKKLPESISECKQLRVIRLYKNKNLEKLPESLSGCINLKQL